MVWITTPEGKTQTVSVKIEGLEVTEAHGDCADSDKEICADGILIQGRAEMTISSSDISGNTFGIELLGSAQADISGSTISGNRWGIRLGFSARATIKGNRIEGNDRCGISSSSNGEVRGEGNEMADNGNDLCGNLSESLRLPLVAATEQEITYPDWRYGSLQEAVDALLPGGVLRVQTGTYQAGVTITKQITIEAVKGAKAALKGKSDEAPVLSLVGEAKLELAGLEITGGEEGLLLGADARATISNSSISGNSSGIFLNYFAQVTISNSFILENKGDGILLGSAAQATIEGNRIFNNGGYGVALDQRPCFDTSYVFTGHVSGKANDIPGPEELDGNKKGAVCPSLELHFLMTEEGGEYSGQGQGG